MAGNTFAGKKAVVSGASGTIGSAIAQRIVDEGGSVTVIGRREGPLKDLVTRLGNRGSYRIVDVDSDDSVEEFGQSLDRVDALVCTAGWTVIGPVEEVPVAEAVAMFNARFFGQCRLIKSTLPRFDKGGIILMCSGVGNRAFYPYYAFGSSVSGAIEVYAHHLAAELAPRRIRVNVMSPGWTVPEVRDPERAAAAARRFMNEEQDRKFSAALDSPMHELIDPEEFADAVVFAARSRHYTGQVIRLDAARSVTDKPLDGAVDSASLTYVSGGAP
jgi:NAD(P)-dependent dehydrogenase (short-subunit alcohol dehydrogenase family)